MKNVFEKENIVGNSEYTAHQYFFLAPQCFPKAFIPELKVLEVLRDQAEQNGHVQQ